LLNIFLTNYIYLRFAILVFMERKTLIGCKITKNISFQMQNKYRKHFFLPKNKFFLDFCLFCQYFRLYLRMNLNKHPNY